MNRAPDPRAVSTERARGQVFCFADFELDADARRLTRRGEEVVLPPRVFDLLLALLHSPGVLLTRERLLGEVWADTVVADSSLTQSMSVLRRELEKDGARVIRTIPRVGYRLEVPVRVVLRDAAVAPAAADAGEAASPPAPASLPDPSPPAGSETDGHAPRSAPGQPPSRGLQWVAAAAAVVLACGAAWWGWTGGGDAKAPRPAQPSVAALDAYAGGLALVERFQPRLARERLRRAVDIEPGFAAAHLVLARVLDDLGQRVAARVHVDRALALATSLTPEDLRQAQALALELRGQWPEACRVREQAVSAPAASVEATLGLAHCLIRDDRANRAITLLTRILPRLQGSERWRAMLLDAQAQIVLARYDAAIARAREVGAAAAAMDAKALRARALTVEAEAALLAGKQAESARANDEAAALLRTLGDAGGAAIAEQNGTLLMLVVQEPARAEAALREHLALAGELGEPVLAAQSRRLIAAAQKAQGRIAESRIILEQALADYVALGDRLWQAKIDVNLAMRDQLEGDFAAAEARVRDAMDAVPAQGYNRVLVQAEMAYVLRQQGRYEDALQAIELALEAAAATQAESRILEVRCERSAILSSLGRVEEARADLQACARFDRIESGLEPAATWAAYAGIRLAEVDAVAGALAAGRSAWETAVGGMGRIGNAGARAAMQIEAIHVGILLGVEADRLRALLPQASPEMIVVDLRARMADALLRRVRGDAGWADALAEIGDRIHPSDWGTRSWWLLLQAARDPSPWRGAGAETLRAEAVRRADERMIALLGALARAEPAPR